MARVAVFIEQLPTALNNAKEEIAAFAYDLIRSLADQQHDIRIFSTYVENGALPESHPRIEILRPFRTWSWLEVPRLLPLLVDFKPEILHVIQPHAQMTALKFMKFTNSLPQLVRLLGGAPSVLSIFDLQPGPGMQINTDLAKITDMVSVRNQAQKELLTKSGVLATKIRILPITGLATSLTTDAESETVNLDSGLELFFARYPIFFYIPGSLKSYRNFELFLETLNSVALPTPDDKDHGLVIGGALTQLGLKERRALSDILRSKPWGSRVLFTGELSTEIEARILKMARGVVAGGLRTEGLSFLRLLRGSLKAPASLVLADWQISSDPLPWKHGQNALIYYSNRDLQSNVQSLLMDDRISETTRQGASELGYRQATDDPGNLMSRWYAHMLQGRSFAE